MSHVPTLMSKRMNDTTIKIDSAVMPKFFKKFLILFFVKWFPFRSFELISLSTHLSTGIVSLKTLPNFTTP